jgi:hypothetical protein
VRPTPLTSRSREIGGVDAESEIEVAGHGGLDRAPEASTTGAGYVRGRVADKI